MGNRIPRKATKLKVTSLVDSSMSKAGTTYIATKTDRGWTAEYNGKTWCQFIEHLRNEQFCTIEVLE